MPYNFYPQSAADFECYTAPAGPTPTGTIVTAGSANNKGSYAEIEASLPFACNYVHVTIRSTTTTGCQGLLDIATGAGGAEVDVLPNLIFEAINTNSMRGTANVILLPLAIEAGTRVSARIQATTGGVDIQVVLTFIRAGDIVSPTSYTALGIDTGTSLGTLIDPGGTTNTYGAWAELSASLAAVAQVAFPMFTSNANASPASSGWCVNIGTGAAASEVTLIPDLRVINGNSTALLSPHGGYTFPTYIAAGTRVAMQASCSSNDATDRLLRTALYMATAPTEPDGAVAVGYLG